MFGRRFSIIISYFICCTCSDLVWIKWFCVWIKTRHKAKLAHCQVRCGPTDVFAENHDNIITLKKILCKLMIVMVTKIPIY